MTFRLPSGDHVQAFDLGGGLFEFVTRNAVGDTVSTARLSGSKAREVFAALQVTA